MADIAAAASAGLDGPPKARSGFIGGISGLRAIAVLSVVLFHVNPHWLPGGFVGVDVFFVISGFVVAHSVSDVRTGSFREYFFWFYRRRFLRILPAIYLYVLVAVALGILVLPTSDVTRYVETTGIASLFGASNFILLWKAGSYFATSSEYNTFTHTWSLAVEEQYYFLFPVFSYWLIVRKPGSPRLAKLSVAAVVAVCLLSLVSAWYFTHRWPAFAFYMLPTRLWELGIGFLLRYQGLRLVRGVAVAGRSPIVAACSVPVLGALLVSLVVTSADAFPWPGALVPCFATAALIAIVWLAPGGWLDRLLQLRVLRFFGDLSYSLYLWHWGVVVLMRWTVGLDTLPLQLIAIVSMLALALMSYHLVERPLRHDRRLLALGTPWFFGVYALVGVAIAGACFALLHEKPHLGLAASNNLEVWDPAHPSVAEPAGTCPITRSSVNFGTGLKIGYRPTCASVAPHRIFVVGDSHAGAYQLMMHHVAARRATPIVLYWSGGCRVLDIDDAVLPAGCAAFRDAALAEVRAAAKPGDLLFLPGLYTPLYRNIWDDDVPADKGLGKAELPLDPAKIARSQALLGGFLKQGLSIIIEAPKPSMPTAVFRCADWFNRNNDYCRPGWRVPRAEIERRRSRPLAALVSIQQRLPAIRLWDPLPMLCDARFCNGYRNGKPIYYDTHHLTAFGDELLLPNFLATLDTTMANAGAPKADPVAKRGVSP